MRKGILIFLSAVLLIFGAFQLLGVYQKHVAKNLFKKIVTQVEMGDFSHLPFAIYSSNAIQLDEPQLPEHSASSIELATLEAVEKTFSNYIEDNSTLLKQKSLTLALKIDLDAHTEHYKYTCEKSESTCGFDKAHIQLISSDTYKTLVSPITKVFYLKTDQISSPYMIRSRLMFDGQQKHRKLEISLVKTINSEQVISLCQRTYNLAIGAFELEPNGPCKY